MVAFRAAASCSPTKAKPYEEEQDVALLRCEDLVRRILHETEADSYTIYLGGGEDNFRYKIYPEYKGNRTDKPKPTWLQLVREHLVLLHPTVIVNGIESDDAMGIEQCDRNDDEALSSIIVSNDKDMLMIPGWNYNPISGVKQFISYLDGLKHFYQQLIQGDQSDNIPGYDGKMRPVIPKFLQPVIDDLWACETEIEMFNIVDKLYWEHCFEAIRNGDLLQNPVDRIRRNGQLLWIQRKEGDIWKLPIDVELVDTSPQ